MIVYSFDLILIGAVLPHGKNLVNAILWRGFVRKSVMPQASPVAPASNLLGCDNTVLAVRDR